MQDTDSKKFLGKPQIIVKTKTRKPEKNEASDTVKQYTHQANIKHNVTPSQLLKLHTNDLFT